MKKALFIFLFFSKSIFALTSIEIGTIKGQASFEKNTLKEGQKIDSKIGHLYNPIIYFSKNLVVKFGVCETL